jgi:AFG3 family protein
MDGFGTKDDIIVLAATNRKEMLDNALTRPGRFDRIVEIDLPDLKGRKEILEIYLKKIKLSPVKTLEEYSKRLATLTFGFSGADLANLCNEAAILAVRREKKYVESEDFESASDRVLAGL